MRYSEVCVCQHLLGGHTGQEALLPQPQRDSDYCVLLLFYWVGVFSSPQGKKWLILITYEPLNNQNLPELLHISATHTSIYQIHTSIYQISAWRSVLVSTGIFFLVAGKVLCFGFGMRINTDVLDVAKQCLHRVKGFSASHLTPTVRRAGGQNELGGDTARTSDPHCPKGCSIPYGVMISI